MMNENERIDQAAQDEQAFDDMMAEGRIRRHLDDTIEDDDVVEIREVSLEEQGNRLGDRSL